MQEVFRCRLNQNIRLDTVAIVEFSAWLKRSHRSTLHATPRFRKAEYFRLCVSSADKSDIGSAFDSTKENVCGAETPFIHQDDYVFIVERTRVPRGIGNHQVVPFTFTELRFLWLPLRLESLCELSNCSLLPLIKPGEISAEGKSESNLPIPLHASSGRIRKLISWLRLRFFAPCTIDRRCEEHAAHVRRFPFS